MYVKVLDNFSVYNKNITFNYATQPKNFIAPSFDIQQDTISFSGAIKPTKINDTLNTGKKRLIKEFDVILNTIPRKLSEEEMEEVVLNRYASFERSLINRAAKLEERAIELNKNAFSMKPQQYINIRNELLKELNRVKKSRPNFTITYGNKYNIKDFVIINKMKSSVMNDDFDLKKVFIEHYSDLNEMKTIDEVKEKYPDIILPLRPENVIADKIVTQTLNRKFFEKLNELFNTGNKEEAEKHIDKTIEPIIDSLPLKKYNMTKEDFVSKIIDSIADRIMYTLHQIEEKDSYCFISEILKPKKEILSDEDFKLISIDFDEFILTTLREQFLNFTKIKDIESQGVKAFSLKDRRYKIEKIPSKILSFIANGMDLKKVQRNYDKFSQEDFIDRLYFYSEHFADNEQIFESLIDFGTCRFEGEDVQLCAKFLRELDSVFDKEKSIDEVLDIIKHEDIRPRETEKLNEQRYQQAIQTMKTEQKRNAQLRKFQDTFDYIINILYKNNMNYVAEICAKYRPASLNVKEIDTAEFMLKTIMDEVSKNGAIINKAGLDAKISRWSTYNEYLTNNVNDKLLKEAQIFASKSGKIDVLDAGKYLINRELIHSYPKSLEYAKNKEILKFIMENSSKEKACEYLCKFDSYNDMPNSEKSKILEIMKHFDTDDEIDKELLKMICEKHYSQVDTTVKSKINSGGKTVDATITAGAKQEIMEYFKFPGYLEFLPAFEKALSKHTTAKGNSGIKIFGSNNNSQIYEMEIKIKYKNSVARLVSTNNDYVFDKFIPLGLH